MRIVLIAAVAAATSLVGGPARATTTSVHLDVDVVTAAPLADCDLAVPTGSNGLDVLDAAVTAGCIESYQTESFGFGEQVTCINDLCQTSGETLNAVNWTIFVDGHIADSGVSDLSFPADGSVIGFSYGPWLIYGPCFFAGVGCP